MSNWTCTSLSVSVRREKLHNACNVATAILPHPPPASRPCRPRIAAASFGSCWACCWRADCRRPSHACCLLRGLHRLRSRRASASLVRPPTPAPPSGPRWGNYPRFTMCLHLRNRVMLMVIAAFRPSPSYLAPQIRGGTSSGEEVELVPHRLHYDSLRHSSSSCHPAPELHPLPRPRRSSSSRRPASEPHPRR
jgi:hypothetical protein